VVGGAVHSGLEVLLREGQQWIDKFASIHDQSDFSAIVEALFSGMESGERGPVLSCRVIEDRAVAAALTDFAEAWGEAGVEMDPEEARQRAATGGQPEVVNDLLQPASASQGVTAESPIVVDFSDFGLTTSTQPNLTESQPAASLAAYQPFDADQWLREEMAALVEGMVRCWARRRWRDLLSTMEVLEVEREGEWKLAEWVEPHVGGEPDDDGQFHCARCGVLIEDTNADCLESVRELHFLSRHDALLLERSTGYLYLQSFKTTGAWDRRKELDAQVDMQGLSEAVDIERRFGEAWEWLHTAPPTQEANDHIYALVSKRTADWLLGLPDPPTILGVRYEYLLKGSRKENKKAGPGEPRWNQESVLVRAYAQEGITSADRRWAWSYEWKDEQGKSRRLDYRSWQKQAVWRQMTMAEWIDLLDQGKVQEGALGEDGEELDALGAQLVPVLVQYRNRDETLDWLEQTEAQEVQVARDVEAVRQAEREGGYAGKRSALNRLFPMTRTACSYPGVCSMRSTPTQPGFCFGPPDAEHDPAVLEHYRGRVPNHPAEGLVEIEVEE